MMMSSLFLKLTNKNVSTGCLSTNCLFCFDYGDDTIANQKFLFAFYYTKMVRKSYPIPKIVKNWETGTLIDNFKGWSIFLWKI